MAECVPTRKTFIMTPSHKYNLAAGATAILVSCTAAVAVTGNDFERFKSFLESPPPISEVCYAHYYPGRTNSYRPIYTLARWQVDSFFRRISYDPESLRDPPVTDQPWNGEVDCISGTVWWKVEGNRHDLMIWDPVAAQDATENPVRISALASLREFSSFMNMGVQHAPIGSIRWKADSFECTNANTGSTWILHGELAPDSAGRAGRLDLSLVFLEKDFTRPRHFQWRIDYLYEKHLSPSFLPDRITTWLIQGDRTRVLDEYDVSRIILSDRALAAEAFIAARYQLGGSQVCYVSNTGVFYSENGKWHERWKANDRRIIGNRGHVRALYLALVLLLFAPLLALWRGRAKLRSTSRRL
jgi:hypothetical protein